MSCLRRDAPGPGMVLPLLWLTVLWSLQALLLSAGVASAQSVWPKPQSLKTGTGVVYLDPGTFSLKPASSSASSQVLTNACERYRAMIQLYPSSGVPSGQTGISSLVVQAANPADAAFQLGADESYVLSVNNTGAWIQARTVWGALRGLETFFQLLSYDFVQKTVSVPGVPIAVADAPAFAWRGLMIDTARHWYPPSFILHIIDAMAINKFNTLHWHIIDAQSAPLQVDSYPLLAQKAVWAPGAVYAKKDIQTIVEYARQRGIRVVPEFDTPGHAYGIGVAYPNLVANCPAYAQNINNIPLNPIASITYDFLTSFLKELLPLFPDQYVHIGGDEIVFGCWSDDPSISAYMAAHKLSPQDLYDSYHQKLLGILNGRQTVGWEELFEYGASNGSLIQVWSNRQMLQQVAAANHPVILSAGWYLDRQEPDGTDCVFYELEDTWKCFYQNDPLQGVPASQQVNVWGGSATMWSEQVDQSNFDSRVWPRASAIAERLWAGSNSETDLSAATIRLVPFRCSMVRRGVGAGPVAPDFCWRPRMF